MFYEMGETLEIIHLNYKIMKFFFVSGSYKVIKIIQFILSVRND